MNNVKMITIMVLSFGIFGCASQGEYRNMSDLEAQVEQLEAQVEELQEETAYQGFIIGPGVDLNISSFDNFLKAADFWGNITVPSNDCSKKCSSHSSKQITICTNTHPIGNERKECVEKAVDKASICQRACPQPSL